MGNQASPELLLADNDRTFNALWVLGVEEGSFACECGGTDCGERLALTLIEYAARDDGQALLVRGHATTGAAQSSLVSP
jgi:hypothetical protein